MARTHIRHLNRGDVKDGGCPMCKPRHKREEDLVPVKGVVEEGLEDLDWWEVVEAWGEDARPRYETESPR